MTVQTTTRAPPKKPTRPYKPKVKTGCMSCRTRRVKCDEAKPSCKRCVQTGRTCDGYEDLFRPLQWAPVKTTTTTQSPRKARVVKACHQAAAAAVSSIAKITPPPTPPAPSPPFAIYQPPTPPLAATPVQESTPAAAAEPRPTVTREDVAALAMRFSNKHGAEGFEDEARMSLEASLSEPAVRHAIASLTSLYETLEHHGHGLPRGKGAIPAVYEGLQEYHNAMVNLASKLSSSSTDPNATDRPTDPRSVEVALVCCRMFISIEVMLKSYVAVTNHYFRGMRIMREASARAYLEDGTGRVVPSGNPNYPKVDVFMIKMFCAPEGVSPPFVAAVRAIKHGRPLPPKQFVELVRLARIEVRAARAKAKLVAIAEQVVRFLDRITRLQPDDDDAASIVAEKQALLQLLHGIRGEVVNREDPRELGAYHGKFIAMFHAALWIPTYSALWSPTHDIGDLAQVLDRVLLTAQTSSAEYGNILDGAQVV